MENEFFEVLDSFKQLMDLVFKNQFHFYFLLLPLIVNLNTGGLRNILNFSRPLHFRHYSDAV